MDKEIYIINPDYILKEDGNRYLLQSYHDLKNDSSQIQTFLHPMQVQLFSYFAMIPLPFNQIISQIATDYGYTLKEVEAMVIPFIENKQILILKYCDSKIFIPKNFLIKLSETKRPYQPMFQEKPNCDSNLNTDLKTVRCNRAPYNITFMLTNKCCTHCCYCYADITTKVDHHVPVNRIIDIIKEAKRLQLHNIQVIGGEIFLYKYWDIVLDEIIKNGFMPEFLSTKIPITENIIQKLQNVGFTNRLQLSIDTLNQDIANQTLHAPKGYIIELKKGIDLLETNGIPYQIGSVLTKWTATESNLKELYTFFSDKKQLRQWEIRPAMYSLDKNEANFQQIKVRKNIFDNLTSLVENHFASQASFKIAMRENGEGLEKFRSVKDGCQTFKHGQCSALNTHLFILPDGKVTICEQLYWNPEFIVGDINESSLEEIWHSKRMMELVNLQRKDIKVESACKRCHFFEECFHIYRNRCWVDIVKAYGKMNWDFPDPCCAFAPDLKNNIY